MNKSVAHVFVLTAVCFLGNWHIAAQTSEALNAQAQVNRILEDSSKHFRDGMTAFSQSRRADAGKKFDDAVEVFLSSTLNIQGSHQRFAVGNGTMRIFRSPTRSLL